MKSTTVRCTDGKEIEIVFGRHLISEAITAFREGQCWCLDCHPPIGEGLSRAGAAEMLFGFMDEVDAEESERVVALLSLEDCERTTHSPRRPADFYGIGANSDPYDDRGVPGGFFDVAPPDRFDFWHPALPEVTGVTVTCEPPGDPDAHVLTTVWWNTPGRLFPGRSLTTARRLAHLLLLLLFLALPAAAYDRPRWADADRDCKDTRAEVLEQQCATVTWDARGCRVRRAACMDVYSGAEIATDTAAQSIQVDHIYPASVACARGTWLLADGSRCTRADRCPAYSAFFNDAQNLLATRSATNRDKAALMPAEWCPATRGARILAAKRLRAVAARYRLPLTARDEIGLRAWAAGSCASGSVVLGGGL